MKIDELLAEYYPVIDGETFEDFENDRTDRHVLKSILDQINEHLEDTSDFIYIEDNGNYFKEEM